MTTAVRFIPHSALRTPRLLSWQGWQLSVPADWSPVKIEGDFDKGFVAMADLERERIGLRWQTVKKGSNPATLVADALRREVGRLSFAESTATDGGAWPAARVFVEPDPPGRDVWVAYSPTTRRLIQIVYRATRREPTLCDALVPTVRDTGDADVRGAREWSVFWLNVALPRPMALTDQRLNAGDLSLSFTGPTGPVMLRQLAAAGLALGRRPMEGWLAMTGEPKRYRAVGKAEATTVDAGQTYAGVRQLHVRRRRLFFALWIAPQFVSHALRDRANDRLVLVRAPDDDTTCDVLRGLNKVAVAGSLQRPDPSTE